MTLALAGMQQRSQRAHLRPAPIPASPCGLAAGRAFFCPPPQRALLEQLSLVRGVVMAHVTSDSRLVALLGTLQRAVHPCLNEILFGVSSVKSNKVDLLTAIRVVTWVRPWNVKLGI